MQYSPKLKKASEEIKAILKKYDIGAVVTLHTPGYGEYILNLEPSYSAVKMQPDGNIRIRAKTVDFNGDTAKRDQVITDTTNMLSILAELTGMLYSNLEQISVVLDNTTNAEHTKGDHTSHTEQNN